MRQQVTKKFRELFNTTPKAVFFAGGRVNLIGEHTDYNGGYVLPCALTFGTYLAARKRNDGKINFFSLNFEKQGIIEADISQIEKCKNWTTYPKGVIAAMRACGANIDGGFDAVYGGNIPNGAGLSSSASIEVLTGVMLNEFFFCNFSAPQLAKMSQTAEHTFAGVNCGIMDQFIIACGKQNNALLLDCNTLKYEYIPVELGPRVLLIANTNKRRELADSKYNERRAQCENALGILGKKYENISALCSLSADKFASCKPLFEQDEVLLKRARHAVSEQQRTLEAAELLKKGDIAGFGKLMNASHKSLKEDYEVTGKELDSIVAALQAQKGVLGARMMGGGFGGSALAIAEESLVPQIIKAAGEIYHKECGLTADFYTASVGGGARRLEDI